MKATLTAFALASLAGCAVADSDPDTTTTSSDIIGGQRENGLPAVGAISYDGTWGCTGTLIGPYRVLTAAHCVLTEHHELYAPSRLKFLTGTDAHHPQHTYAVASVRSDPDYDGVTAGHDFGLIILEEAPPIAPMATNDQPLDAASLGKQILAVGYGTRNTAHPDAGGGVKYGVWAPITGVAALTVKFGNATHNTCYGDSGGPAFVRDADGELVIAGVDSLGDDDCKIFTRDGRVDKALGFIRGE